MAGAQPSNMPQAAGMHSTAAFASEGLETRPARVLDRVTACINLLDHLREAANDAYYPSLVEGLEHLSGGKRKCE